MIYISDLVVYAIEKLKKHGMHTGRTNIQKMIFFSVKDVETLLKAYQPYHYGPFSEKVQHSMQNMENIGFIKYDNGYSITDFLDKERIQENEDDKYKQNISHTIDFLMREKITEVNDIAAFSKVYYYVLKDPNKDNLEQIIKNNAPFVWPTLMDYKEQFPRFIQLSKQLNSELQ